MKNLIKGLLTNRFGIVLAALNVCYFVSNNLSEIRHSLSNFDKVMLSLNFPAGVFSFASLKLIKSLFPTFYKTLDDEFGFVILLFFITLQSLFIGWTAKAIARRLQPEVS